MSGMVCHTVPITGPISRFFLEFVEEMGQPIRAVWCVTIKTCDDESFSMNYELVLPSDPKSVPEFAVEAETLGYDGVWLGELWGENAFVELAAAAERTDVISLGTAIVNVYSRSPAVLAMGAASLARLSDNRFNLGIGVSTPKAIEDLHGQEFTSPIKRTIETIELVTQYLSDTGRVEYSGDIYAVQDFPSLDCPVPIFNAALGSANREVTGRYCDGWLPNNVPVSNLESAFETIADAAVESGRDPQEITVAPWIHVAVSEDPGVAMDAVRGTVAYYVGASTGYERAVGAVYPDAASRVAGAWRDGNRDAAREAVTDEMVLDLGCAGSREAVQDQLRELASVEVIDSVLVDVPDGLGPNDVEATVEVAGPANL